MLTQRWSVTGSLLTSAAVACLSLCTPHARAEEPVPSTETATQAAADSNLRVTVDVARDRAKLLHEVYSSTLLVMHDRYFHDARAIVPARALEDVFAEMNRQTKVEARWISVNTKAMSIQHEPKTEFEKHAAAEIADGKEAVERIDNGKLYRATPIPLVSECISCHTGFFAKEPKGPRYAALVLTLPIDEQ